MMRCRVGDRTGMALVDHEVAEAIVITRRNHARTRIIADPPCCWSSGLRCRYWEACRRGLPAALARVKDPRKRRGVRHQVTAILGLAVCAVLAGCRSFAAIGQWATNASEQVLTA